MALRGNPNIGTGHFLTGYAALPPLLFFGAALLYVFVCWSLDLIFYFRNGWDFTKESGIPSMWIGNPRNRMSKFESLRIGGPVLMAILSILVLVLLNAFLTN